LRLWSDHKSGASADAQIDTLSGWVEATGLGGNRADRAARQRVMRGKTNGVLDRALFDASNTPF
jgi:hypothetical protein